MSASFRIRAINVRTFWKLSYESQCTSSIWTERSKCCVVMLRFPCWYNTWALNFVMEHPYTPKQFIRAIIGGVQQLGRTKARGESVQFHALTSDALSRTHFHAPLHRARWRRANVLRTWPDFAQRELNKMRTLHCSLPAAPTGAHSSTRSDSTHSLKHSLISGPFLTGLTALHVLYSASFLVFSWT